MIRLYEIIPSLLKRFLVLSLKLLLNWVTVSGGYKRLAWSSRTNIVILKPVERLASSGILVILTGPVVRS